MHLEVEGYGPRPVVFFLFSSPFPPSLPSPPPLFTPSQGFVQVDGAPTFPAQPEGVHFALRVFLSWVPAGLVAVAMIAILFYPLSRARHTLITDQLQCRRRLGASTPLSSLPAPLVVGDSVEFLDHVLVPTTSGTLPTATPVTPPVSASIPAAGGLVEGDSRPSSASTSKGRSLDSTASRPSSAEHPMVTPRSAATIHELCTVGMGSSLLPAVVPSANLEVTDPCSEEEAGRSRARLGIRSLSSGHLPAQRPSASPNSTDSHNSCDAAAGYEATGTRSADRLPIARPLDVPAEVPAESRLTPRCLGLGTVDDPPPSGDSECAGGACGVGGYGEVAAMASSPTAVVPGSTLPSQPISP